MATLAPPLTFWDQVEPPSCEQEGGSFHSCYAKQLKADLLPGTFVVLAATANAHGSGEVVARVVKAVEQSPPFSVEVNVFKNFNKFGPREGVLSPRGVSESHLKHLPEIVQTMEMLVVAMTDISNLAFVFTEAALQDASNMYYTCQGMANAYLLRYRFNRRQDDPDVEDARRQFL
jgi:hypothetical protein